MTFTHILVPGHWLGSWAWDGVVAELQALGRRATAVTLPGLESPTADRSSIRLADHVDAVADLVAQAESGVVLVAHSGAGKVVSGVLDRSPDAVRRMVYVDSGPSSDGASEDLAPELVEVPLPGWDELSAGGNSLEGLSDADLTRFQARAVPHPAGPVRDPLQLGNPQRREVPTTIICCSLPSDTIRELAAGGHPMFAEVAELSDVTFLDLPTGHWPMWSKPAELAAALHDIGGQE